MYSCKKSGGTEEKVPSQHRRLHWDSKFKLSSIEKIYKVIMKLKFFFFFFKEFHNLDEYHSKNFGTVILSQSDEMEETNPTKVQSCMLYVQVLQRWALFSFNWYLERKRTRMQVILKKMYSLKQYSKSLNQKLNVIKNQQKWALTS